MTNSDFCFTGQRTRPARHKLSRDTVSLIGDLLPLLDFASVLLGASLATWIYANWSSGGGAALVAIQGDAGRAAIAAAVLAPFILCDRAYVAFASGGQIAALIRCYAVRFLMFGGTVAAIGLASHSLSDLPHGWLALWLASSLLVTAGVRALLVANLGRLQRLGVLSESVAVVGAGALADRLIRNLQDVRPSSIEIVGVFDDVASQNDCSNKPIGSIDDLIELGKSKPIDWILLALPSSEDKQVKTIVHRLKSLAVPIGICPQNIGIEPTTPAVRYMGDGLPDLLLADHPGSRWDSRIAVAETMLPRWIITLLGLPLVALKLLLVYFREPGAGRASRCKPKLAVALDDYSVDGFSEVAARFGQENFGYVVTPNADHLIRLHQDPSFYATYSEAAYVLLDSRFISNLLHFTQGVSLPVCTGSDLTAKLFDKIIRPTDQLVLIGGSDEQAAFLRKRYGLKQFVHFNPPMGFIRNPLEVEACVHFIEAHSPFRYCLLAVGSPQQEIVAQQLKSRGIARGLTLCIGASVDFLTGREQRAPRWMQDCGIEWLFRLKHAPRRMASRYLLRGPLLFGLLRRTEITLRVAPNQMQPLTPAVIVQQQPLADHVQRKLARRSQQRERSVA